MTTSMTPDQRLAQLRESDAAGQPLEMPAFWDHKPQRDGSVGRGCLSQWWPAPFTVDGVRYATVEHWMMSGKARLFDDPDGLAAVLAAASPGAAKAAGRKVLVEASPYDRIWGIGLAPTHDDVARPTRWRGLNLLGFALMEVRDQL